MSDATASGTRRDSRDRPRDPGWPRRLTAEAFGTFALVFVAAGADVTARISADEVTAAARAVAPALMVAALIYSIGDTSGAHFNPVVSLAFWLKRLIPAGWLPAYWAAQSIGAIAAALALRLLFGDAIAAGVSTPKLVGAGTATAIEALLTLLLVSVVLDPRTGIAWSGRTRRSPSGRRSRCAGSSPSRSRAPR